MRSAFAIRAACLISFYLFLSFFAQGQSPVWMHTSGGSPGNDQVRVARLAGNGNLYVAGKFSGVIDLDPSAAVFNLISHGKEDLFLAVYSSSGAFIWGFGAGGTDNDMVYDLIVDELNSVYITGYFKGKDVDFDPAAGTALLSDNGLAAGSPPVGGDGFIAKYAASGSFLWCHALGGPGTTDLGESLCIDKGGNIYIGGIFSGLMDIDPAAAVNNLNTTDGIGYVVKYTPSGQLIWGKVIGANSVWAIKTDTAGSLFITGACDGINSDFDPSPTGTVLLAASGIYDAYLAKYDTAFNLIFAKGHGGAALDESYNMDIDRAGNIYLSGGTLSPSLSFGNISINIPGSAENMYMVKYSNDGQAIWAQGYGEQDNDKGRAFVRDSFLYFTGYFNGAIDFDPSAAMANLSSNGGHDIFLCTYDLDGNYICGFSMGGPGHDQGVALTYDERQGYLYVGGDFSAQVEFDPLKPGAQQRNSNGFRDLFLGKYYLPSIAPRPDGYLTGDTICPGEPAYLDLVITRGHGPFTITYTNGTDTFVRTNVPGSGSFAVTPAPTQTTVYTLLGIAAADICGKAVASLDAPAQILVPYISVNVGKSADVSCKQPSARLFASGAQSYQWFPAAGVGDPSSPGPVVSPVHTTIYTVIGTDEYGCRDTASVTVNVDFQNPGRIFFPDAFTPNNDGINDCFRVKTTAAFQSFELSIYNRWGERVFYSVDPADCWDGAYKGQLQPVGTFYYYYRASNGVCGDYSGKGGVHLLR